MYKELTILLAGFALGLIAMFYMRKPEVGNKYEIENNVKNRKGTVSENNLTAETSIKENKRKLKLRRKKNGSITKS